MSSKWPRFSADGHPASWSLEPSRQNIDHVTTDNPVPAATTAGLSQLTMGGTENNETSRQMFSRHAATATNDLSCLNSAVPREDPRGHRTILAPLPLYERTPSEKNQLSGIRVVPYSPPRINAAPAPPGFRKGRQSRAGSPDSLASRRRQNRQRRRQSREHFGGGFERTSVARATGYDGHDDDDNDDDDDDNECSDHTTATATVTTSPGSRGTPATVLVYPDDTSGSNIASGSGGRNTTIMADGRTATGRYAEDGWQGEDEGGYVSSGPESALSTLAGSAPFLARGAFSCVSGPTPATAAAIPSPPDAGRANLAGAGNIRPTTVHATSSPLAHGRRPLLGHPHQDRSVVRDVCCDIRDDNGVPSSTPLHLRDAAPPADPTSPLPTSLSFCSPLDDLPTTTIAIPTAASSTLTSPSLSPSVASVSSISLSQAVPRPSSRRHNVIAVHADKTFSLVSRNTDGLPQTSTSAFSAASPTGSFSEYPDRCRSPRTFAAAASRSLQSPPLSFATSTIRSSSSQEERLFSFSDALGSDNRSSSPLTSITSVDPSRYGNCPAFSSSPGASTICLNDDDEPAFREHALASPTTASTTHLLHDDGLVSGVRTAVPETTPGWKGKGKGKALASSSTVVVGATGVDSAARPPTKKASFASDQSNGSLASLSLLSFSASTVSAATNYKVYAHSSPRLVSAAVLSIASAPHDSSDDSLSLPSSSGSTNVEILGVSSPAAPPLPVLRRSVDPDQTFASLASYPSVASFVSGASSFSDNGSTPNVVILGASSPPAPSHYLDQLQAYDNGDASFFATDGGLPSSPPLLPHRPDTSTASFDTSDSEPNYVLHGTSSAVSRLPQSQSSAASSLVVVSRQLRPAYSQESLIVPPLQPLRHHWSAEKLKIYQARSHESLRHAASIQSLRRATSIKSLASVFGQEAASTFFAGQAFLNLNIPPVPVVTAKSKNRFRQQWALQPKRKPLPPTAPLTDEEKTSPSDQILNQHLRHLSLSWDSFSAPQTAASSSSSASPPPSPALPQQSRKAIKMDTEEHPHHWSSQLSTVASESDGASTDSRAISQSISVWSGAPGSFGYARGDARAMGGSSAASGTRRLSAGASNSIRSHNLSSISSSLGLQLDDNRSCHSRSDSLLLDRPQQLYFRFADTASPTAPGGSTAPPPPAHRTIRDHDEDGDGLADLYGEMTRHASRTGHSGFLSNNNSMRNLHSSASSRSLGGGGFPVWARVYYGSGEHRALSRSTSASDLGRGDDHMERASLVDNDGHGNAHRQLRDGQLAGKAPSTYMEGRVPGAGSLQRPSGMRRISSSVWSPHLRIDRRATHFSVWEPPSVAWSVGTRSITDRRNMQVICFTAGFVCPFFWMLASILPLPHDPQGAMEKRAVESDGEYGMPAALKRRIVEADELRFQSARWWRMLNRVMSIIGLLILGAVAALVVVGVRDHWGR